MPFSHKVIKLSLPDQLNSQWIIRSLLSSSWTGHISIPVDHFTLHSLLNNKSCCQTVSLLLNKLRAISMKTVVNIMNCLRSLGSSYSLVWPVFTRKYLMIATTNAFCHCPNWLSAVGCCLLVESTVCLYLYFHNVCTMYMIVLHD